jgi:threonine/homoserine/homoserine lactone efflux protein
MIFVFLKAIALGFVIAVPVGPAGLVCMQRTLTSGRAAGLAAGLGIAAADALVATLIAGGLTVAADFLVAHSRALTLATGIVLVLLGAAILWARPKVGTQARYPIARHHSFVAAFLLTAANPVAILMMGAALTLFGLIEPEISVLRAAMLVAGVFCGSMLWWAILVASVSMVKGQLPPKLVWWINKAAGGTLVVLGVIAFASGV